MPIAFLSYFVHPLLVQNADERAVALSKLSFTPSMTLILMNAAMGGKDRKLDK